MKHLNCLFLAVFVFSVFGYAADQEPKIRRFNDPNFLLLLEKSSAEKETLLSNVHAKFYRVTLDNACFNSKNLTVAFLYLVTAGDCGPGQLIRLPESVSWGFNIWKPRDPSTVTAHLVREYVKNNVSVIEDWEVSGNGKEYEITKRKND